jgi:glycosyltransferase involved in cell wall biosynthesis
MLKVIHYSGDRIGGAARAAERIHRSLRFSGMVDSHMLVKEKINDDYTIEEFDRGIGSLVNAAIKSGIDALPRRLGKIRENIPRSAGLTSLVTAKSINSSCSDIAHLHWINGGYLSIEEISKISKPLVWTFHDMWPFCGAEHLSADTMDARWRVGYAPLTNIVGFDFDRWVWKRKKARWRKLIHVVTPSGWLADCVRQSSLMSHFPVHVVPNTLDVNVFKPIDKVTARRLLNLPQNRKLVLFGAIKGTQLTYKGWDLLMPALAGVFEGFPTAEAVIFGQSRPADPPALKIPVHWMGHFHDDFTLAALYSAADLLVIPSRQESFGQTGSEAHACGCPVVAFDATGLKDVVASGETGLLVKPYDSAALAAAIVTMLKNDEMRLQYGIAARIRAQRLWSFSSVAVQYKNLYEAAVRR